MELQYALSQIGDIRLQMCRTWRFRGCGVLATACTGLAAIAAATSQAAYLPDPAADPRHFVNLWVAVAAGCISLVVIEMFRRYRLSDSLLQRELTLLAIEQFLPCLIAGGLVTLALCEYARTTLWILPGLWQVFFALGCFASRRLLPGSIVLVGLFYLACGLINLAAGQGHWAYSPWLMGIPFGLGQFCTAWVLKATLEPDHAN